MIKFLCKSFKLTQFVLLCLIVNACTPTPPTSDGKITDVPSAPFSVVKVNREKFPKSFAITEVSIEKEFSKNSIIVDTDAKFLYLVMSNNIARRYPIGVGTAGKTVKGSMVVSHKSMWPRWHPTQEMHKISSLPQVVSPGAHNPLGAAALYLYKDGKDTLLRIHGTSEPWTIGTAASSGCIRMFNEDVVDLYGRVPTGTAVIFR